MMEMTFKAWRAAPDDEHTLSAFLNAVEDGLAGSDSDRALTFVETSVCRASLNEQERDALGWPLIERVFAWLYPSEDDDTAWDEAESDDNGSGSGNETAAAVPPYTVARKRDRAAVVISALAMLAPPRELLVFVESEMGKNETQWVTERFEDLCTVASVAFERMFPASVELRARAATSISNLSSLACACVAEASDQFGREAASTTTSDRQGGGPSSAYARANRCATAATVLASRITQRVLANRDGDAEAKTSGPSHAALEAALDFELRLLRHQDMIEPRDESKTTSAQLRRVRMLFRAVGYDDQAVLRYAADSTAAVTYQTRAVAEACGGFRFNSPKVRPRSPSPATPVRRLRPIAPLGRYILHVLENSPNVRWNLGEGARFLSPYMTALLLDPSPTPHWAERAWELQRELMMHSTTSQTPESKRLGNTLDAATAEFFAVALRDCYRLPTSAEARRVATLAKMLTLFEPAGSSALIETLLSLDIHSAAARRMHLAAFRLGKDVVSALLRQNDAAARAAIIRVRVAAVGFLRTVGQTLDELGSHTLFEACELLGQSLSLAEMIQLALSRLGVDTKSSDAECEAAVRSLSTRLKRYMELIRSVSDGASADQSRGSADQSRGSEAFPAFLSKGRGMATGGELNNLAGQMRILQCALNMLGLHRK